jgi:hypothetical protein
VHVVSDAFTGKVSNLDADSLVAVPTDNPQTTLQRHRMIYTALSDELEQGVHALSLKTKTVQESANTVWPELSGLLCVYNQFDEPCLREACQSYPAFSALTFITSWLVTRIGVALTATGLQPTTLGSSVAYQPSHFVRWPISLCAVERVEPMQRCDDTGSPRSSFSRERDGRTSAAGCADDATGGIQQHRS